MTNTDISKLPDSPGTYIFRDSQNKVLYVGKAVNLKNRVKSYFQKNLITDPKTRALVSKIKKIDFIKVETELESLLLESDLIKRYRPAYNINLKDDKFYKFIKIEKKALKDKSLAEDKVVSRLLHLYTVSTTRIKNKDKGIYFGPYPESTSIHIILKTLRRVFPYRDCSEAKFNRYKKAGRPCLYGHIGLCPSPCQTQNGIVENNKNVKNVIAYLKGDKKKLFGRLKKDMSNLSKIEEYEKAAVIRDQIQSYDYLTQHFRESSEYASVPNLVDSTAKMALEELVSVLSGVPKLIFGATDKSNFRIELFDISNFQGKNAVGSMVVLTGGIPDKKEYRRFKIKSKDTPDDFSMMKEMLRRRFARRQQDVTSGHQAVIPAGQYVIPAKAGIQSNSYTWKMPNLIVVDGGKGQLSVALEVLDKLEIRIPIIGLAKRFEEIVYKTGNREIKTTDGIDNSKRNAGTSGGFGLLKISESSPAINILKKGRDEAHRFAITYYRKLHRMKIFE